MFVICSKQIDPIFFYFDVGPKAKKLKSDALGGKGQTGSNGFQAKGKKAVDSDEEDDDDDDDDESVSNKYSLLS